MPFTPSHAVVALPFARTRLVPAAVAIGAMTPDLPLFLRGMVPDYSMTHDLVWLLPTTLLALVLFLVWRCILRPAIRELSPRVVAERLPTTWDAGFRAGLRESFGGGAAGLAWLVAALAVGVVSHIVWDLFTHEGRLGVEVFPVLDQRWGPLLGVKWLQYASGALGLLVLAGWGLMWLSRRPRVPVRRAFPGVVRVVWWVSLPVGLVAVGAVATLIAISAGEVLTPTALVYAVLTRVAAVWAIATLGLALTVQFRRRP